MNIPDKSFLESVEQPAMLFFIMLEGSVALLVWVMFFYCLYMDKFHPNITTRRQ
jgi:hypothetical protein